MSDPNVFQRVREYLDERDEKNTGPDWEDWEKLIALCRTLSDCVSMSMTFHEAAKKVEEEFK